MIPFEILIAAICTLLIIINKVIFTIDKNSIPNSIYYYFMLGLSYFFTSFYWVLSLFTHPIKWYAIIISLIAAISVLIYFYFVYLYNKEEIKPEKICDYEDCIGKIGKITSKYNDGYIGNFVDTNQLVFINSVDNFEIDDIFKITEINNGKIIAVKIIENI